MEFITGLSASKIPKNILDKLLIVIESDNQGEEVWGEPWHENVCEYHAMTKWRPRLHSICWIGLEILPNQILIVVDSGSGMIKKEVWRNFSSSDFGAVFANIGDISTATKWTLRSYTARQKAPDIISEGVLIVVENCFRTWRKWIRQTALVSCARVSLSYESLLERDRAHWHLLDW